MDSTNIALPPPAHPMKFEEPPFSSGTLEINTAPFAEAIAWLNRALREEQSARRSLELRVSEVAGIAERAKELGSENALPKASATDALSSTWPSVGSDVQQLQNYLRQQQITQEGERKQQQQREQLSQEMVKLHLDEMRNELAAKASFSDLEAMKTFVADQVRDLVTTETRALVHDRLANEAAHLRQRLDQTSQSLSRRLDLFSDQLSDLSSFDVPKKISTTSAGLDTNEKGTTIKGDVDVPVVGQDLSSSRSERLGTLDVASDLPVSTGSIHYDSKLKQLEEGVQKLDVDIESVKLAIEDLQKSTAARDKVDSGPAASQQLEDKETPSSRQLADSTSKVSKEHVEDATSRRAKQRASAQGSETLQLAQSLEGRLQTLDGQGAKALQLAQRLEGRVSALEGREKRKAVRVTAENTAEAQALMNKLNAASSGNDSSGGNFMTIREVLREDVLNWANARFDDLRKSLPATEGVSAESFESLRTELLDWLSKQGDPSLLQQVNLATQQKSEPAGQSGEVGGNANEGGLQVTFTPNVAIANEVASVAQGLRTEMLEWLDNKLRERVSTPSRAEASKAGAAGGNMGNDRGGATSDGTVSKSSLDMFGSDDAAGSSSAEDPSKDAVANAVLLMKGQLEEWLQGRMEIVDQAVTHRASVSTDRDAMHGVFAPRRNSIQSGSVPSAQTPIVPAGSDDPASKQDENQARAETSASDGATSVATTDTNSKAPGDAKDDKSRRASIRSPAPKSGRPASAYRLSSKARTLNFEGDLGFDPAEMDRKFNLQLTEVFSSINNTKSELVNFFQTQLQEISETLANNRAERDAKIDKIEAGLEAGLVKAREELRAWLAEEIDRPQQPSSPGLAIARMPSVRAQGRASDGSLEPLELSHVPSDIVERHHSKTGAGAPNMEAQFEQLKTRLLSDKAFVAAFADALEAEDDPLRGTEKMLASLLPANRKGHDKRSPPQTPEARKKSMLVNSLESRLQALEIQIEEVAGARGADRSSGGGDLMSLLQVGDEVRRLKCRFEYLERIAPPDVRSALDFFEHVRGGEGDAVGEGGAAAVMHKVHDMQTKHDKESREAKELAEDSKREVMNVSKAVRHVQKDSEVNGEKIGELQSDLISLRARIEAALPELRKEQRVGQYPSQATVDGAERSSPSSPGQPTYPFVHQEALHQTLDTLHGTVQVWLEQLRGEIMSSLQGKADNDALELLSEQIAKQEQQKKLLKRSMLELRPDGKADGAAFLKQAKCVSCDTNVNVKADMPPTWPPQAVVPPPPFPHRAATGKDLRPLGAGMQRNASLPALKPVAQQSGPHFTR